MSAIECPRCHFAWFPKIRSTGDHSANRHLNGHIAQLCRETKNDWDDVKIGIKARSVKRGFPEPKIRRAGGRSYEVWKSEANCTASECSMLIDECHQIADELGIVLIEEKEETELPGGSKIGNSLVLPDGGTWVRIQ